MADEYGGVNPRNISKPVMPQKDVPVAQKNTHAYGKFINITAPHCGAVIIF